jgi:hypothetical protein
LVSAIWDPSGTITHIGFSHPLQFGKLHDLGNAKLTTDARAWLLDPTTYGKRLEWVVASCAYQHELSFNILCIDNKPSQDSYRNAKDIMLSEWDPIGKHANQSVRISPDKYGVGNY